MSAKAPNLAAGRSATVALAGRLVPGIIDADGRAWAFPDLTPANLPTESTQLALPGLADHPEEP